MQIRFDTAEIREIVELCSQQFTHKAENLGHEDCSVNDVSIHLGGRLYEI
jgi:hypothetical protein